MATDATNEGWNAARAAEGRPIYEIPLTPPEAPGWARPVSGPFDAFADTLPASFLPSPAEEAAPAAPPPSPAYEFAPVPVEPPAYVPPVSGYEPPAYEPPAPVYQAPARAYQAPSYEPSTPVYQPPAAGYESPTATPTAALADLPAPAAPPVAAQPPAPEVESDEDGGLHTLTPAERETLAAADKELVAALRTVVTLSASDLHVTVGAAPMVRIDGALTPAGSAQPWGHERTREALFSLLDERQRVVFERELELDFAFTISANSRFRVNIYQQRGSVGAAFRLIPTEIKGLHELGIPESVSKLSQLPRGLVLVTGPTGSGKSTTLAALIDLVNTTRADHIVTVEDPIEFMHTHKKALVNQREVGHDTHSFNNALKHVLRQDPDVILIGELRDLETISVALTAAETGHLVFATLHTQDAPQTIDRVIDVFPPHQQQQVRAQLAATLQGVICQTLVKKASGRGRAVATEVMLTTPAIANLIREGKTYQIGSMMQAGRDLGMHTMDQHLADLVDSGAITRGAAFEKAHDPVGLDRLIQRVESPTAASAWAIAESGPDFGDRYSGTVR
ncbi:type IV pilus twitching motility protein PilT [Leifsonia sp. NPDC056824]|uniref:type IV pilus twitching motility protein PilT n=1 Tax=Leifsonia sp. NPDC056824 TaxID=3345953 RepID=UPI0036944069